LLTQTASIALAVPQVLTQTDQRRIDPAAYDVKPEMISFFFDWAGEIDRAMEWIEKGYELRDHQIVYSAVSPYSDALRADPRFQDIIRRIELPV
jgi:hypothetical protein